MCRWFSPQPQAGWKTGCKPGGSPHGAADHRGDSGSLGLAIQIWGGLGMNLPDFEKQGALLDQMFDFASESDRAKIRGLNAQQLYRFRAAA